MAISYSVKLEVIELKNFIKILEIIDQEYLFLKCKIAFEECITLEENKYLINELSIDLRFIYLENDEINISFKSILNGGYIIETKIALINKQNAESVGYYSYQEDMNGDYFDEFLVFY